MGIRDTNYHITMNILVVDLRKEKVQGLYGSTQICAKICNLVSFCVHHSPIFDDFGPDRPLLPQKITFVRMFKYAFIKIWALFGLLWFHPESSKLTRQNEHFNKRIM